jgi:S1-C subfamily serine protease
MRFIRLLVMTLGLAFGGGFAFTQDGGPAVKFPAASESLVTVIAKRAGASTQISGTGVVVRSDGLILTAYHLVKDAAEVQIKLQNGEIFDRAEVVKYDERRNGALLRIS